MGSNPGSLVVVGVGIRPHTQLTPEAASAIESSDAVHFVVPDLLVGEMILALNGNALSLADLYSPTRDRAETYQMMIERILSDVRAGLHVCAVFYGHPGVFVDPSHEVIAMARSEGVRAEMFPAVSAADCLYADLGIDPGTDGLQMHAATEFLLRDYKIDPHVPLLLWQMAFIGAHMGIEEPETAYLSVLVEQLLRSYSPSHEVTLYEAPTLPGARPVIVRRPLEALAAAPLRMAMSLYIPPIGPPPTNAEMRHRLGYGESPTT